MEVVGGDSYVGPLVGAYGIVSTGPHFIVRECCFFANVPTVVVLIRPSGGPVRFCSSALRKLPPDEYALVSVMLS